jgi:hypothetical protein
MMKALLHGAIGVAALSLGVALTGQAQAQQANEAECRQIWERADAQNQGYLSGSKAQAYRQAMAATTSGSGSTAQSGTTGGAGGGTAGSAGTGTTGQAGTGAGGGTAGAGDRLMRSEFLAACMQNPQAFRNVRE